MALWKQVSRRVVFAVVAIYLVVSITFGFVALTADPNVALVAYGASMQAASEGASQEEAAEMVREAIDAYKTERGLDRPVGERYVQWMMDITTLNWGYSYTQEAPVTTVLAGAIPRTLAYLIPALLFALVGGVGIGVYSALNPGSLLERLSAGTFYLGYGIPNYWLAMAVLMTDLPRFGARAFGLQTFVSVVLPAAILGTSLLAGQLRYARAESREYVNTEFLKLIRAKGASNWVVAKHVLRNVSLPLFSLFFADVLGVLVVEVFVLESPMLFNIDGIGNVGLTAIEERDMPLILGVAMVFAFAGIVGNLIQDLAYLVLDPRVEEG